MILGLGTAKFLFESRNNFLIGIISIGTAVAVVKTRNAARYALLSPRNKKTKLKLCKKLTNTPITVPKTQLSAFSYSNSNYLMLALIVEKQSGMMLADYIQQHIFNPAGMKHSYFVQTTEPVAVGYENMGTPGHPIDISLAYGSGNLLSTASDLFLYDQAIKHGKLLSKPQVDKMQTGYVDAAPFGIVKYGYAWNESTGAYSFNHRAIGHSGGYTGFRNFFLRFVDDDVTVIVLSNNQGKWSAGGLSLELASILLKTRFWYIVNHL